MSRTISAVCRNITPSATLRLNAIVNEKRAQGLDIIGMGAGEPDFPTPDAICAAAKQAIDAGKTKYTAASGVPELRKAVADHVNRLYGLSYQPSQVLVGTGAKQVLVEALVAILDPGDEVILPAPCWLSYPEMIRMAGGVPRVVLSTAADGFLPTAKALQDAVTPRTRAILINTPNNPTGAVWNEELLRAAGELAVQHDLYIISDEIYETLVFSGARHVPMASIGPEVFARTITISGWSKAYAMTGWRLGYALGAKDVIDAMGAYQSHATGNPNSIAQYAALEALTGEQRSVEDMRLAFE
ncbi:MAG: pyridoxal phosphate-dependent aminotransferase, partial [Clostridiales bacterium]|nr:pyridoxal phosphate-dependent aminotransferase [Clostridiales bacterium]